MSKKVLKEFSISDLLNRELIEIDTDDISNFISNKRVLITGATGSIGSELVRQIIKFNPESITFFDHNENNQFFLEKEIKSNYPNIKIISRIGSITDFSRVKTIFEETMPQIVYHAAANKHVPLCESNVSEAIQNNILGTHIIADMTAYVKAEVFTLISTDKAVNPTSVMGCTKRVAEYYTQIMSKNNTDTRYVIVRFGNVLGSIGSVVPIFKSQIEKGGPITVTHKDMSRFFMTIPEATQLLLQASVFGDNGSIYVLDMGEQIKIIDLAEKMITLSGLKPYIDIDINFSGIRPGEKIHEELFFNNETADITKHKKIRKIKSTCLPENILNEILKLELLGYNLSNDVLKQELFKLVPEALYKKE